MRLVKSATVDGKLALGHKVINNSFWPSVCHKKINTDRFWPKVSEAIAKTSFINFFDNIYFLALLIRYLFFRLKEWYFVLFLSGINTLVCKSADAL